MEILPKPFYRKASAPSTKENCLVINMPAKMFMVSVGVPGPDSPSNPGVKYHGNMTGGQMVTNTICNCVSAAQPGANILEILVRANKIVRANHLSVNHDPALKAVAGASVSAFQLIEKKRGLVVLIGDCFALYQNATGLHFVTNFDQSAFDFDQNSSKAFSDCLKEACGDKGVALDFNFPNFARLKFFCANRNISIGGRAVLNGNGHFLQCLTTKIIELDDLKWILLGTGGLLTADCTNPRNREQFEQDLGQMYSKGGLPAILEWRDKTDFLPHISGYPEATAIEIIIGVNF